MAEKFDFLAKCSTEDIARLKKEMADVMSAGPSEIPSALLQKVNATLNEFSENAATGKVNREYHEATEVMEICAGCCGVIHGKQYWQ